MDETVVKQQGQEFTLFAGVDGWPFRAALPGRVEDRLDFVGRRLQVTRGLIHRGVGEDELGDFGEVLGFDRIDLPQFRRQVEAVPDLGDRRHDSLGDRLARHSIAIDVESLREEGPAEIDLREEVLRGRAAPGPRG